VTFDEFLTYRLTSLLRFAMVVTCDPHVAEDVVQEVLLRANERWARIGGLDQPEAYLKRMVVNEYISWRRRATRVVTLDRPALDHLVPPTPDPADGRVDRDDLAARVARLTPKQRAVVALRYYDDRSDAEIADVLGCSEGTVRAHASRALATLRAELTEGSARRGL
jgi:RNA polymerase sigma-70 factor (sigma-E family)